MTQHNLIPESKLPLLGTTIFSQMSALAQQHNAINLSQGFPDFSGPDYLQQRLAYHVSQGANQYAPMTGALPLREAIAEKTARLYDYRPDVETEITVTAGATEALYAAITALVRPGDEVICFDPSYDSYAPAVELSGGVMKRITLQPPAFRVDWQAFAALLSDKTRLVILNTPHNPSATVWQQQDFAALWQAIAARPVYVLSDEVYEHICFDQAGHASVLAHPELRQRAIAVSSFGKTFHMTGWKVGYCIAPAAISAELRKVHQYLTFSVNTPAQLAIADMLREHPELKAILASNDNMALGAVAAIKSAGKTGKVLVVGYDNISAIKPMLADGRVLATVDQYGAKQAVFGIDTALKAIKEKKAQKDLAPVVETQVTLVTK